MLRRDLFPHADRMIYMEHAALAPLARPVVDAVSDYLRERSTTNPNNHIGRAFVVERVRERAARLLGAPAASVELAPTTSWGLNLLALGYPWKPGDRVVVPDCEFPANAYPWLQLERFGVEVDLVPSTAGVVTVQDLARAITPRTRVVAVSWVQYLSGYRLDLAELAGVTHAAGALLSVDATQGLGALQLDAPAAGVDFLVAGAQKWLLGLQGAAVVYVAPDLQERLSPIRGWLNGPMDPAQSMGFGMQTHDDARRFRVTWPAMEPVLALDASLELLLDAGVKDVERRVVSLSRRLAAGFDAAGFRRYGPQDVDSGIVTIEHADAAAARAELHGRGIHSSLRAGMLRFSPHAYNTDEEVEAVLDSVRGR